MGKLEREYQTKEAKIRNKNEKRGLKRKYQQRKTIRKDGGKTVERKILQGVLNQHLQTHGQGGYDVLSKFKY